MVERETCAGLVLSGGRGRRMGGRDKGALRLGDRPLADLCVTRLSQQVRPVALNAPNGDAAPGVPLVPDSVEGFAGPLAGVLAGMDWAAGLGRSHLLTVAVDTPFFPGDLRERLAAADGLIAVARTRERVHGTCALWPVALREVLRADLDRGVRKVMDWIEARGGVAVEFQGEAAFFNINPEDDLAEARRRLGG